MSSYQERNQVTEIPELSTAGFYTVCDAPGQRFRRVPKRISVHHVDTVGGATTTYRLHFTDSAGGVTRIPLENGVTFSTSNRVYGLKRAVVLQEDETIQLEISPAHPAGVSTRIWCSYAEMRHPESSQNGWVRNDGIRALPGPGQVDVVDRPGLRIQRTVPWVLIHNADTVSHDVWIQPRDTAISPPLLSPGIVTVAAGQVFYWEGPMPLDGDVFGAMSVVNITPTTTRDLQIFAPYWEERIPEERVA